MTESVSESENPAIASPTSEVPRPRTNQDWWPNQLDLSVLHRHSPLVGPDGRGLRLRQGVRDARRRGAEARPDRADDLLAGVVAGGLRPLRPAVHPHELARRRHLSHHRRSRRRRQRLPALRAAEQLAGQREPRQGAPAAVADQAEVRPQDLVGRPARLHRQRRDGIDGLSDVRLRLRARGHLGARRDLLGLRGRVAGRRALQRRARAGQTARRRADGPDLRQPGGAGRQPRPAGRGQGHPRDVRAHGDERRRDARADRRRPHLRQDARRRRPQVHRPRARGRADRAAGPRLEEQLQQRHRRTRADQRAGGSVDERAGQVGQRLLDEPVRVRVGADREPGRREAVDAEEPRGAGHRARRPRPVQAPRADDADDGSRVEVRSDLRADRAALLREPRPARRGVRQGLVQAAAPRHGPGVALPRPVDPRAAALAGPRAGGRSRADRRGRHRRAEAEAARLGTVDLAAGRDSVGVGRLRSAAPTSAAAPTARAFASLRRRTGRSTNRPSWPARCRRSSRSSGSSTTRSRVASECRSPT